MTTVFWHILWDAVISTAFALEPLWLWGDIQERDAPEHSHPLRHLRQMQTSHWCIVGGIAGIAFFAESMVPGLQWALLMAVVSYTWAWTKSAFPSGF